MYCFRTSARIKLYSFLRSYSLARKSHYEVLNLRKDCTSKEIKEAYIKLSKAYHPDKNNDVRAQEKFVQIVEAYNVLSKHSSRTMYDNTTEIRTYPGYTSEYKPHVPYNLRKNPKYSYYYNDRRAADAREENPNSFYKVSRPKTYSNYTVVLMCAGLATLGVLLQIMILRERLHPRRDIADSNTKRFAAELDRARAAADENGNELQTKLLLEKIVSAANTSAATASLGQELANKKRN